MLIYRIADENNLLESHMPRVPVWDWIANRKSPYESHNFAVKRRILSCCTRYSRVSIIDTYTFGKVLLLEDSIQSAESDEFIYHEALVHPVLCSHTSPRSVLILGGGEGATLREVLKHRTVEEVIMVDIDEELVGICRELLPEWSRGSFEDERAEVIFQDGQSYLSGIKRRFDVIICDLTDPEPSGSSDPLYRQGFFKLVRSRLSAGGLFCTQATSFSGEDCSIFRAIYRTIGSLFPIVHPLCTYIPSLSSAWGFIIASDLVDPLKISTVILRKRVKESVSGRLLFYGSEIHRAIMSLPPYMKGALKRDEGILQ